MRKFMVVLGGMILTTSCDGSLEGNRRTPRFTPPSNQPPITLQRNSQGGAAGGKVSTEKSTAPTTVRGSGRMISRVAASRAAVSSEGGGITLNFVDAEISAVVKTVLGTTLRQNFAIDPSVKGTMTLLTSRPIPTAAVLPTLESALRLSGVALVRTGQIYRVMRAKAAARAGGEVGIASRRRLPGSAFGIEIVPMKHAAAGEMAEILKPLMPPDTILRTDTARNLLIVAGTSRERQTIGELVAIFDVDWMSGMSFAIIPLKFAQAKEVITDLERVFGADKVGPGAGLVRFFPVERRNAVLVISARSKTVEDAKNWVARLDIGGAEEKQLFVYRVENGRATDLAAILGQVFSDSPVAAPLPSRTTVPGQRTGSISSRRNTGSLFSNNRNTGSTLNAQTFGPPLSAAQARPAAPRAVAPRTVVRPTPPARPVTPSRGPGDVSLPRGLDARIIPDDVNNSLVIMATPRVYRMIDTALKKLDVVPLQVMIEATIAEVTLNDDLRYGLQWFFNSGSNNFTLSDAASGAVNSAFPGFSYAFLETSARVILDALDSITNVRVVSSPQVLVLDNRTAELQVGDQVPISTQQSVSNTDPDAPTVNSIEFRDTGVVLRVTPRVNNSGLVNLEIQQEESSAVPTTSSGIDSPTIQQRRISSSVVVNSGQTVALGGLIRDTQTRGKSGVPFLSDIPILGNLFGRTTETGRRTELLILITPRVVRNQEEARAVTQELRERLRDAAAVLRPNSKKP